MGDNAFVKAIRGKRTEVTRAIDVTNELLGDLVDRKVITQPQHDQIYVRCFTVFSVYIRYLLALRRNIIVCLAYS